jgi:hypothetical protein
MLSSIIVKLFANDELHTALLNIASFPEVGTYSDIRDQRYRTELDIGTNDIGLKRAESDIISDIGIRFYPISDIRHPMLISLNSG